MNVQRLSVGELNRASADLAVIADQIAADHPEAAALVLDAIALASEELLARAFGGSAKARKFAKAHIAKARAHSETH